MARRQSTRNDDYSIITSRIVSLLESGTIPWRKPWRRIAPQNLASGKLYRGINPFLLACSGYSSPYWLTFRQAKQLGGHVSRGAKSTPVVFWKVYEKQVEGEDGEEQTVRLPVLRYYSVFNLEQCQGIPAGKVPDLRPNAFEPIQEAEGIVQGMPQRPPIKHGATGAWYMPATDTVSMPDAGHFDRPESYYSTFFHELVHNAATRIMPRRSEASTGGGSDRRERAA